MEELFGKFREDEAEKDEAPFRKKKKFKKNAGLEKPEPEETEEDPDVEDLVERMAGASASAVRAKNRFKKRGKGFQPKKDEDEEE